MCGNAFEGVKRVTGGVVAAHEDVAAFYQQFVFLYGEGVGLRGLCDAIAEIAGNWCLQHQKEQEVRQIGLRTVEIGKGSKKQRKYDSFDDERCFAER